MAGCLKLGESYRDGVAVEQDYDRAMELFMQACNGSLGEGCYRAGDMYLTGTGVGRDLGQAAWRFRRACRLGYEEACRQE
jgi:hypothetical protein